MRERRQVAVAGAAWLVVSALALGTTAGAGPRGYFPCPVLVFFDPCPALEDVPADILAAPAWPPRSGAVSTEAAAPGVESLWAEPRSGAEAGGPAYVPPRPVREFLEAPTPDRARAYLAWNEARLQAIAQATEVLRLVATSEMTRGGETRAQATRGPTSGCVAPAMNVAATPTTPVGEDPLLGDLPALADPRAPHGVTVLYAFASWCPYSARQTPLVAAWARSRPDVPVTGLLLDSPAGAAAVFDGLPFAVRAGSPALREQLGVRSYPTLLVLKDGVPVERFVGLTAMTQLEAVIRALGE
jgi:thiol-disulfide isomerase/thioredoxin